MILVSLSKAKTNTSVQFSVSSAVQRTAAAYIAQYRGSPMQQRLGSNEHSRVYCMLYALDHTSHFLGTASDCFLPFKRRDIGKMLAARTLLRGTKGARPLRTPQQMQQTRGMAGGGEKLST